MPIRKDFVMLPLITMLRLRGRLSLGNRPQHNEGSEIGVDPAESPDRPCTPPRPVRTVSASVNTPESPDPNVQFD
jgi:hypothetical protein